jgi:hypothetical protein
VKYSRDDDDDRFDDDDDDDRYDSSSSSYDDDDDDSYEFVLIDGIPVKVRGDGSFDDDQPYGARLTNNGLKLRGNGTIDDSQPYGIYIAGTRRGDRLIGTGAYIDNVTGLKGDDRFICGNRRSSYYLDKRGQDETYMSVQDFRLGNNTLVLSGDRSDYKVSMTRLEGVRGVAVAFRERNGNDLVAFLENARRRHLRGDGTEFLG